MRLSERVIWFELFLLIFLFNLGILGGATSENFKDGKHAEHRYVCKWMFESNTDCTFSYLLFCEGMISILICLKNTFVDFAAFVLTTVRCLYEFLSFGLLIHRSPWLSSLTIDTTWLQPGKKGTHKGWSTYCMLFGYIIFLWINKACLQALTLTM